MNIQECKQIQIAAFLAQHGYHPAYQRRNMLWYRSPLRDERTPSFKVDLNRNLWYDFGMGSGGNIISLVMKLFRLGSVVEVLHFLSNDSLRYTSPEVSAVRYTIEPDEKQMFEDMTVNDLHNEMLLHYITGRGISREIAIAYCKELRYKHKGKRYFAIAFPNRTGGYELRNPYFKGSVSPKDVSAIAGTDRKTCSVFEGFMDCLSYVTMLDNSNGLTSFPDCLVLNSVSNVKKALTFLKRYPRINLFLDNDKAGREATDLIVSNFEKKKANKVTDCSYCFAPCKDFNEWWGKQSALQHLLESNKLESGKLESDKLESKKHIMEEIIGSDFTVS